MRFLEKPPKKLDLDKELEKWLGKKLVKEGNTLLNNSPPKDDLIVRYLIAKQNWNLSLGEIGELQKKNKKLDSLIQILKRD